MVVERRGSGDENPRCPRCGAGSWRSGMSRTGRIRYKCKVCGKKFDERAGTPFHWLHKPERDILTATVLYLNYPFSSYQVKEILELFGVKVSARQVERWPKRFGPSAREVFKRFKVNFSKSWRFEEGTQTYRLTAPERPKRKLVYKLTLLDPDGNVVASYTSLGLGAELPWKF